MSLRPLTTPWFHGPTGHEKIWLGCAILWCFVMSLMMPYWHFRGKQNSTGEAYTVKPADFYSLIYFIVLLIAPLVLLAIKVILAKNKRDYHRASTLIKLIMLFGILYSVLVFYLVNFKY